MPKIINIRIHIILTKWIDIVTESNLNESLSYSPNSYVGWMCDAMQKFFDVVQEFIV